MPEEIAVCSVVKAELCYGAERSSNPQEAFARLEEFLAPYRSLPFDDECARVYGQIRARLARAGLPIGPNDLLIARHSCRVRNDSDHPQHAGIQSSRRAHLRGLGSVIEGPRASYPRNLREPDPQVVELPPRRQG